MKQSDNRKPHRLVPTAAAVFALLCGASSPQVRSAPLGTEPYLWHNVVIGGGGFVTGIVFHPRQKDLIYARTDVGGAYRWDAAAERWIPLTDWIGAAEANLIGIESIAVDPSDPDRVYLAAGTYTWGKAAILRSADQGRILQQTDVPFRMGANEAGRFNGERLAVDPHQGEILFFGSREDGLWRSPDRGASWRRVESFPAARPASQPARPTESRRQFGFGQQPVGIVCVLFDPSSGQPGSPTPVIYVAVSTIETNLYRSIDAGRTWRAVANQPTGLRPNHLVRSPDGLLYLSYGRQPGPNTMTDGAIWKFNPKAGAWADITPVKPATADHRFGYGSVAVDARHPSAIMVATFCHWSPHDEIFRSTNAGASWEQIWQTNTVWDHSSAPYTRARNPHWIGDIQINPFNSDQVLFTTGYGIWSSLDATAADSGRPTHWVFMDRGLEETVPLALISPPQGAHLLSGLGDIDGFRHDRLTVSPPETFVGPHFGNTEDLAYAGKKPQVIARTGTTSGRRAGVRAAYSLDGGATWAAFASEPADSAGAGNIAVSADGGTFVWTPRRSAPHFTLNYGTNWTACGGLTPAAQVVADPVRPSRFYAYDPRNGRLYASTNGAADFSVTPAKFPIVERYRGGFGGGGGAGAVLYAAPGREGDLWLAFRNNGLDHSTNGGLNFDRVGGVPNARSLGFGKPAAGKSYPALYLAGRVGGFEGLFRSDDEGRTWVRINDDEHQFGWINHVTGDPRLYGRVYFATGGRGIIYGDPAVTPR